MYFICMLQRTYKLLHFFYKIVNLLSLNHTFYLISNCKSMWLSFFFTNTLCSKGLQQLFYFWENETAYTLIDTVYTWKMVTSMQSITFFSSVEKGSPRPCFLTKKSRCTQIMTAHRDRSGQRVEDERPHHS